MTSRKTGMPEQKTSSSSDESPAAEAADCKKQQVSVALWCCFWRFSGAEGWLGSCVQGVGRWMLYYVCKSGGGRISEWCVGSLFSAAIFSAHFGFTSLWLHLSFNFSPRETGIDRGKLVAAVEESLEPIETTGFHICIFSTNKFKRLSINFTRP